MRNRLPLLNTRLAKALDAQIKRNRYRFHVPAHAGVDLTGFLAGNPSLAFMADLTELPELDVLGNPQGVLFDSQAETARLFGVAQSFYLINGASVGLMAALLAAGLTAEDRILVARNCHRSIVHGLILTGTVPVWLMPQPLSEWGLWGSVEPEAVEAALAADPAIRMLALTHPTYEGIPSDVAAIARICRKHNVLLLVDEAHGSLWPLSPDLPVSAVEAGADAVVHSLHKSGGSLTQTALLHLPEGSRFHPAEVQQALNILQTTSPSYVLLANMEATLAWLDSDAGRNLIQHRLEQARDLRARINAGLSTIRAWTPEHGRSGFQVFLKSAKLTGGTFAEELEETHDLAYEAATERGVLLNLNLGLPDEALEVLWRALSAIEAETRDLPEVTGVDLVFTLPQLVMSPREAFLAPGESIPTERALGRVARQVIATCPPGIPILIPGEAITHHHLPRLSEPEILVVR